MKISIKQYSQTLFDLTSGKSEQEVLAVVAKFAQLLKDGGQLKNASAIMEKFSQLYSAANGIIDALVTSSRKLSAEQTNQIEKFIKEKYSAKEVVIENIVDEKIQGGIIMKIGDEVLDSSVRSQLKRLQNILSK